MLWTHSSKPTNKKENNTNEESHRTSHRYNSEKALNNHNTIAIIEADKNLGTYAVDRAHGYIKAGIDEHLGDKGNYKPISQEIAVQLQHQL